MPVACQLTSVNLTLTTPQTLELSNSNTTATLLPGNYVATRVSGQQLGAYSIQHADNQFQANGDVIASVHLAIASNGVIYIDA